MAVVAWVLLALLLGGLGYVAVVYICAHIEEGKYRRKSGGGSLFYRRGKVPLRSYSYRAVELKLCDDPCEVALSIAGKRLLRADAPALPLPGCRFTTCQCSYVQYDDRRIGPRRDTSLYGISV
ncbi:MAG: hypothetical protein LBR05_07100, partial [Azoarcus sp.]|nr:hypothetical protein [Azoarcus sp.]